MYYACQNTSGLNSNYLQCQQDWTPEPGVHPVVKDVRYEGIKVTGAPAFRSVWLECTPDRPCEGIAFDSESLESFRAGTVNGFACNHAFAKETSTQAAGSGIPMECQ